MKQWHLKLAAGCALVLTMGISETSHAVLVPYVAPTGQTATADYSFISGTQLQIILTETTPTALNISGGAAILTSVGFNLPTGVNITGGTVTINSGSTSVGFQIGPTPQGPFGGGTNVSGEWGFANNSPLDSVGNFDFASTNTAQTTQFAGSNLDGPADLNGPQGGLLDDSAQSGGLGVIDNSIIILLTLNTSLSAAQQAAFLAGLCCNPGDSIVEWGSNDAFGAPVPEPGTLLLLGSGLAGLGFFGRRKKRNQNIP